MRKIDITKQDIRCCDDFYMDENGIVNIPYELWFDVDEYFGTNTKDDSTWVNFYTFYNKDRSITAVYIVDTDGDSEEFDWELTEEEQNFFRNMMEEYCVHTCGCTIKELVEDFEKMYG